jgi:hypothetical protein
MKRLSKILVVFILLIFVASLAWSAEEETEKARFLSINFVLLDSVAFVGVGAEVYLANLLGIGGVFSVLPLGANGNYIMFYEAEGYVRLYFFGPDNSLFFGGNVGYFSAVGNIEDAGFSIDAGLLDMSPSIGYNIFMGKENNARFAVEVGPRFTKAVVEGNASQEFLVNVFFQLMFGMNF